MNGDDDKLHFEKIKEASLERTFLFIGVVSRDQMKFQRVFQPTSIDFSRPWFNTIPSPIRKGYHRPITVVRIAII